MIFKLIDTKADSLVFSIKVHLFRMDLVVYTSNLKYEVELNVISPAKSLNSSSSELEVRVHESSMSRVYDVGVWTGSAGALLSNADCGSGHAQKDILQHSDQTVQ